MNKKWVRKVALDHLVGRNPLEAISRIFGRSLYDEEEKAEVLAIADKIRQRKQRRGQFSLKRTYARYCKKEPKGCSYCWPYEVSQKYANKGWISKDRIKNPKYELKAFGELEEHNAIELGLLEEYYPDPDDLTDCWDDFLMYRDRRRDF